MVESQRHYVKRKKLNKKRIWFILYDFPYKVLEVKKDQSMMGKRKQNNVTASGFGGQGAMVKEHKEGTWTDDSTQSYQESELHRCLHLTNSAKAGLNLYISLYVHFIVKEKQYKQMLNSNY